MKTISSLKLRNRLGEVLDEVRFTRKPIVVLKNEKPVVWIFPYGQKRQKRGFDIHEYRRLLKDLPPKYQVGDPDPDLLALVGSGNYVALEDEDRVMEEYLREKHG